MNEVQQLPNLPVTDIFPQLDHALTTRSSAVLVAPPGAGKTTLVPLHILNSAWRKGGMIVLLEPRRLAARASARRMAALLGEEPGQTVGYRMRLESKVSDKTRILVVTEGVFARMILDDPDLKGVAAVVFDEFHERSLDADFGLALALDVQAALREDLRILVMSATIDGARVAELLGQAPVIVSEGRSFPVEIRYRERKAGERIEEAVSRAIRDALADEEGSILAFLPGQGEIERTAAMLAGVLPPDVVLAPLYGAMDGRDQDLAIRPAPEGTRKVVLATSIAETSLTIDGVRLVIDSGLVRQPVHEPATGLTRLETVRASRAAADQRAGRAGRTAPGIAIRLWHSGQTAAMAAFAPPEIVDTDLTGLVLDCAAWGVNDPRSLAFLDPPPAAGLGEARSLLRRLNALDAAGRLTADGVQIRALALPVRLAHMVAEAGKRGEALPAAELAVLLTERGLGGNLVDLDSRMAKFRHDRSDRAQRARSLARRLASPFKASSHAATFSAGRFLIDAYPDRIARARGQAGQYLLANGRGGELDPALHLSRADWIVVADMTGKAGRARIVSAAEIQQDDLLSAMKSDIETGEQIMYDSEKNALRARQAVRIGAITLSEKVLAAPGGAKADAGVLDAVREHGLAILPWGKDGLALRRRLDWLHRGIGDPWPDMSDANLLAKLDDWLLPFLSGEAQLSRIAARALRDGLMSLVPFELQRQVDQLAPTHFEVPTGSNIQIRYDGEEPVIAVRVQELYGLNTHPSIAAGRIPLLLELLSPAHRPIQVTRDLVGFWNGSWADVRTEMRGRYPKHVWPESPATAVPTTRAKPRGQ